MSVDQKTGEVIEAVLVPQSSTAIVKPAVTVEEALEAWRQFDESKQKLCKPEDYQEIQGKKFPKKVVWRKMASFFNLTVELTGERRVKEDDGSLTFEVTYRASAPNGRAATGDGACNTHERKNKRGEAMENSIHNTRGQAHTRAYNRAVSNLIGGGEVSAEELPLDDDFPKQTQSFSQPQKTGKKITPGQLGLFWAKTRGWDKLSLRSLLEGFLVDKPEDLKMDDFNQVLEAIQEMNQGNK